MSLLAGDLTTPARVNTWLGGSVNAGFLAQVIPAMTSQIYGKLNRSRLYSQPVTRIIQGVGNNSLVLPDWPVTGITQVQIGAVNVSAAPLPTVSGSGVVTTNGPGWGFRWVPWNGNLPGDPTVLEFLNGAFWPGIQNIKVQYTAGYLIADEPQTVPTSAPWQIIVNQPQGIWCRDNGVAYANSGTLLTPVLANPTVGQYILPPDTNPGQYTLSAGDASAPLLISYSFIPNDLEMACILLVAESNSYRNRVGAISQGLGGQESGHFMRGGNHGQMFPELPPEVEGLVWPYVSTLPPAIGAPV